MLVALVLNTLSTVTFCKRCPRGWLFGNNKSFYSDAANLSDS
jgi:hypothetical protein